MSHDNDEYDDGKTLIAGVLYDNETGEEADDGPPENVIACTIVGDDEVTDEAVALADRILADLDAAGFMVLRVDRD